MPEYEILQDAPQMTLSQVDNLQRPATESKMSALSMDEADIMQTGPSIDLTKRDTNYARLFGKSLVDTTLKVLLDNPVTHMRAIGKELDEGDPYQKRIEERLGIPARRQKLIEKFTAVSTAIRDSLGMTEDELTPRNWFEQVVSGLGGAVPSIGASAAASVASGGVATVAGAGPKAVKAAQLAGAAYASFSMEKPVLEKELLDAGFEGGFADRMSTYYAVPVAMLDAGSFGFLTGVLKPTANAATSSVVGKMTSNLARFMESRGGEVISKALEEGTTEAIQGQIQTEFETRLGLQNRDFQKDLSSRSVEFVVGALMGGSFGLAHVGGQLQARKEAIATLSERYNLDPSLVAKAYDASTMETLNGTLDELSKDRGDAVSAQVAEKTQWIQKGIDKAMGRTPDLEIIASQVEKAMQPTADQLSKAQETLMRGESQIVKAKVRELQGGIREKQKEVLATRKELASAERELRLLKKSSLVAFKEQEGRDPKDNELGNWTMIRSASLENKIQTLSQKSESVQGQVAEARTKFRQSLENLPEAQKIMDIEEQIARKNSQIEALSVAEDPQSLEKAGTLAQEIQQLEAKLAQYGKPEARVEEAEQALDTATSKLEQIDEDLRQAEGRLKALRSDALTEFITEKNRQPKPGELETWTKEEIAKAEEAIAKNKATLTEQIREVQNLTAKAEAYQIGLEKVTGSIRVSSGLIRQQSLSIIRQYQRGFYKGGKLAAKEANGVIRVAQQMITSLPVSDKKKVQLLRRLRAISVERFNEKLPQFMGTLNEVMAIDRVKGLQGVAKDILLEMSDSKARNVGPKMQIFSEHLLRVLSGKVPANLEPSGDNTVDIAKYAMETLVADLRENDTDVGAAERTVAALKDFYTGELSRRLTYKEQVDQTNERIAKEITAGLTKQATISPRQAGLDAVRQRLKQTGLFNFLFPTPYVESFLTIANDIDAGQGKPNMQGAMVREFDPGRPYRAWMTLISKTREAIDDKIAEIYGPRYLETLTLNRTANFIDVPSDQGSHNITKSAAMSLYMMQKNSRIRQQLIDLGYSEAWLDDFSSGNAFSKQDHAWMAQVDEILKDYAKQVAPLFEKLTGKPFRAVDNYFMVQRYMFTEEGEASDEVPSVIKDMMDGAFEAVDPFDDPKFKQRRRSKREFVLPAIEDAVTRYSADMNHFLSYAEYATKLDALLKNGEFRSAIDQNKQDGISKVLNQFLKDIVDGSQSRVSDRAAMRANYQALGWLARNKIVSPRSGFMQFTALAGFTDPTASTPVSTIDLAKAALSLPEAIKSGELKNLLDTGYMKERWLGAFDQAAKMAEETSRYAAFQQQGKFDPCGILRKLGTSKVLHEWMSISTRLGDRAPSVIGGWAVYQKVLDQTQDPKAAVEAAIKMIEEVNGSLDPGKSAEIYSRKDFVSTLFKLFTRSTSIYLDRYLRMHKAALSGQITKAQYAKGLALYHVWIPMFTSAVSMGAGAKFDDDEMKTMMLAGPLSYHLFIGAMFKSLAAAMLQMSGLNEHFAAGYQQGGDMLDGVTSDFNSARKHVMDALEYPDTESMWQAVAYVGKTFDMLPLPVGYLSRQPEALMKVLQGDWAPGLMEIAGYSSAATKVE